MTSSNTSVSLAGNAATALRNAWALTLGDGIEAPVTTPSTVLSVGRHRTLRRYDRATPGTGNPVLLVPPLAVPISCYDLRPGQSLAQHLLDSGRDVYVVDYGDITFADRRMGFEDWIDDILPSAINAVSLEHGGADVHLIGWSLGGTMSYLTGAAHPTLPIASLATLGTPVDYRKNPATALVGVLHRVTGDTVVNLPAAVLGGMPRHLVRLGYRATAPHRELMRPWFVVRNLTSTESLARMESIDRFMASMPGYPGRLYLQMTSRLILRNELARGVVHLNKQRAIHLADLRARVLVIGSSTDVIAPAGCVRAATGVLTGAASCRYVEVTGSHLGLVAGADAANTTWPVITDFLSAP